MQKQLLFILHGVGTYGAGWSDDAASLLAKKWDAIPECAALGSAAEAFEIVPLSYDSAFEEIRTRWREDLGKVKGALGEFNPNSNALDTLQSVYSVGTRDGFFDTHVVDLLLYYLVPMVRERICSSIFNQIRTALLERDPTEPWSLIAHSMGTSVAHDVLQGAITHSWGALGQAFPSGVIRLRFLAMLSNCSGLLERKRPIFPFPDPSNRNPWDVYSSRVWPGDSNDALADYYLNITHALDPVAMPSPFAPKSSWPGRADPTPAAGLPAFIDVPLKVVTNLNVHSLEHYLADPACYIPMFRLIGGTAIVPQARADALIAGHNASGLAQTAIDKLKQRLATANMGHVDLSNTSAQFGAWASRLPAFLS